MGMENYSLSDIRAVTDNADCGFGGMGGGWLAWILLFALFGGGMGGFGGNRFGCDSRCATVEDLAGGFNFSGVNNKLNEITAGIAGVNTNLGNAICSSTYELANKIGDCCCQTQLGIQQVRYDMAVQNGDLKALIHSEGEATRAMLQQNKIESLQAQVNQLQLAQATCGLPRINQYAWGVYPYTCGCNPCGGQVTMG